MPTREIGLMGYVGEAVVGQWLERRFPAPQYEVVRQVMPVGIPKRGGPYLDYAVVSEGIALGLYEVKSQDIIWEVEVNLALKYLWANRGQALEFESQDRRHFQGSPATTAWLILLGPPNAKGMELIGHQNLGDVLLFEEIVADLGETLSAESILTMVAEDVPRVLAILRQCMAGKRVKPDFLAQRKLARDSDNPEIF